MSEGHRVTLTYNLRALSETATGLEPGQRLLDRKLATAEQKLAQENGVRLHESSNRGDTSSSGKGWVTAADVSASAELAAELKTLLADKTWHGEGEAEEGRG